jgi:integrase/recombinase XerC
MTVKLPEIQIQRLTEIAPTITLTKTEADIWQDFLSLQISPKTKREYAKAIGRFFELAYQAEPSAELIARLLALPKPDAYMLVLKYRQQLIDLKRSPSTINTYIAAVKSLFSYAEKIGMCGYTLKDIKNLKVENYRDTTGLEIEQIARVVGEIDRLTPSGLRDYAILSLLWDNALRRSEVANLDINDRRDKTIQVLGKGNLEKTLVYITPETDRAIDEWLEYHPSPSPDRALFVSLAPNSYGNRLSGSTIYNLVNKYCRQAGITKQMSPHRIRHSAITAALDLSGGNVREVQQLSRHKNLRTLQIYDDKRHQYQKSISQSLRQSIDS